MVMNSGRMAIIDRRRLMVAQLLLRGLTQREIIDALAKQGMVNPKRKTPWTPGTICHDVQAVRAEWLEQTAVTYNEYVASILAQIRAVRREAWREKNWDLVLRCLKQERDLVGLDKAKVVTIDWREEARASGIDDPDGIVEDLAAQFAAAMVGSGRDGGDGAGPPTDGKGTA